MLIATIRKQGIIYPQPQPELATAITELTAAAAKVAHVKRAVREWPTKVAQAESELADIERQLDHAETDHDLTSGDTSTIDATIKALSAEIVDKREAFQRLSSRRTYLIERGEAANIELEQAKRAARTQRGVYVNAVREAIAVPFAEAAAHLAQFIASLRALSHIAGLDTGWIDLACIPDFRLTSSGTGNLLAVSPETAAAAATAIEPTLDPLRTLGLLLSTSPFDHRPTMAAAVQKTRHNDA